MATFTRWLCIVPALVLLAACGAGAQTAPSGATPTPPPLPAAGLLTATNPAYPFYPAPTQPPPGLLTATPPGYPFLPAPTRSSAEFQGTVVAFYATAAADALLAMTDPSPTRTPLPDGATCYVNRAAGFTLKLAPGWHSGLPWDRPANTMIYNYDESRAGSEVFQPGWQKIDLSVYPLPAGATFDGWVQAEREREIAGDPPTSELTDAQPHTLGAYRGVSYTYTGFGDALLIKLSAGENVISIALLPADSSMQAEALALLATLDLSGDSCG